MKSRSSIKTGRVTLTGILVVIMTLTTVLPLAYAKDKRIIPLSFSEVQSSVVIKIIKQQGDIIISPEDMERGYILVEDGSVIEIDSVSGKAYALSYELKGHIFRSLWTVDQSRKIIQIGNMGIFKYAGRNDSFRERKKLSYKLYLSDHAKPGKYSWPIDLKVLLEQVALPGGS